MSNTDFSELIEFRDKIAALGDGKCEQFCDECNKELAQMLLAKVVKKTRTGVVPKYIDRKETKTVIGKNGKKRKFLTAKAATYQEIWNGYEGGTLKRGWTTSEVSRQGDKHTIKVINQVPYASYVEYGHRQEPGRYVPAIGRQLKKSWVKGQFMLTKSVKELKPKAQGIVDRKLIEFLQEELK
jgi:hypothetical protein